MADAVSEAKSIGQSMAAGGASDEPGGATTTIGFGGAAPSTTTIGFGSAASTTTIGFGGSTTTVGFGAPAAVSSSSVGFGGPSAGRDLAAAPTNLLTSRKKASEAPAPPSEGSPPVNTLLGVKRKAAEPASADPAPKQVKLC